MRELRQDFSEFGRWLYDPEDGSFEAAEGRSEKELEEAVDSGKQVVTTEERLRIEADSQPGAAPT